MKFFPFNLNTVIATERDERELSEEEIAVRAIVEVGGEVSEATFEPSPPLAPAIIPMEFIPLNSRVLLCSDTIKAIKRKGTS